jgi:hypothetical protein
MPVPSDFLTTPVAQEWSPEYVLSLLFISNFLTCNACVARVLHGTYLMDKVPNKL